MPSQHGTTPCQQKSSCTTQCNRGTTEFVHSVPLLNFSRGVSAGNQACLSTVYLIGKLVAADMHVSISTDVNYIKNYKVLRTTEKRKQEETQTDNNSVPVSLDI